MVFKSHACQNIDPLTLDTQEEDLHRRREEFLCLGNEGVIGGAALKNIRSLKAEKLLQQDH